MLYPCFLNQLIHSNTVFPKGYLVSDRHTLSHFCPPRMRLPPKKVTHRSPLESRSQNWNLKHIHIASSSFSGQTAVPAVSLSGDPLWKWDSSGQDNIVCIHSHSLGGLQIYVMAEMFVVVTFYDMGCCARCWNLDAWFRVKPVIVGKIIYEWLDAALNIY